MNKSMLRIPSSVFYKLRGKVVSTAEASPHAGIISQQKDTTTDDSNNMGQCNMKEKGRINKEGPTTMQGEGFVQNENNIDVITD